MHSRKRLTLIFIVLAKVLLASSLYAQDKIQTATPTKVQGKVEALRRAADGRLLLREGWSLQTSAKVEAKGEAISTPRFSPKGWLAVTVPTTVVAALVKDKTFPDPLF